MIRLHKDDRELVIRIDLDTAPSSIEKLWATYETLTRIGQLELMKIAHGTVLLLVTQLLVDTCTEKAAECADRADNPDTEAKSVVH